jgi:exodeoxyribonuclease VIII
VLVPQPFLFAAAQELPEVGIVHGLPNAVYQASPAVSNTQLKAFRKSPFHFHALYESLVPEIFLGNEDESRNDVYFPGTLCHCATLEPEAFGVRYIIGPEVNTRAAKAWKDFVDAHRDQVVITPRQHAVAMEQAASLRKIEAVAEILEGGRCEVSAFWRDTTTGLRCRCRPDCANSEFGTPRDPRAMLLDVKTTRDASRRAVQLAIARYGYHHQCAWYRHGYEIASGIPVAGFIFAFVESDFPFAASIYELDLEAWQIAERENREALDALAQCRRDGIWPGYSGEVESIGLPRWAGGSGDY